MTFELLSSDAVITVQDPKDLFLVEQSTFRVAEFVDSVREYYNADEAELKWWVDGVECEMLQPNQPWRKGKIKLVIAFIPDQPEQTATNLGDCFELNELREMDVH